MATLTKEQRTTLTEFSRYTGAFRCNNGQARDLADAIAAALAIVDAHEPSERFTCAECGGADVEHSMWVDLNSGETRGEFGTWCYGDNSWCRTCEKHVKLDSALACETHEQPKGVDVLTFVDAVMRTVDSEPSGTADVSTDEETEPMTREQAYRCGWDDWCRELTGPVDIGWDQVKGWIKRHDLVRAYAEGYDAAGRVNDNRGLPPAVGEDIEIPEWCRGK